MGQYTIDLVNQQTTLPLDEDRLRRAVELILDDSPFETANISLAVLDDPTIHKLNVEFLEHDYATDVLSFVLEESGDMLEGEILVSADTAAGSASRFGWTSADELLLYVIHGTLHLIGYDDHAPKDREAMRDREAHYLAQFGLTPCYDGLQDDEKEKS